MTTISQARLDDLTASAATFHDIGRILAAISQIASDWAILLDEGRTHAASGAEAALGGSIRRLCATAASSRDEAEDKVFVLERLRHVYRDGDRPADVLMAVMVDAAIAIETEAWFAPTHRH